MKTLNSVTEIRVAIENKGGLTSFSHKDRTVRPLGCPMKRMIIKELQTLTKEEIHIAFRLGLIGNSNNKGTIIINCKR